MGMRGIRSVPIRCGQEPKVHIYTTPALTRHPCGDVADQPAMQSDLMPIVTLYAVGPSRPNRA